MALPLVTVFRVASVLAAALLPACQATTGGEPMAVPGAVEGLHETPAHETPGKPAAAAAVGKEKASSRHASERIGHGRR